MNIPVKVLGSKVFLSQEVFSHMVVEKLQLPNLSLIYPNAAPDGYFGEESIPTILSSLKQSLYSIATEKGISLEVSLYKDYLKSTFHTLNRLLSFLRENILVTSPVLDSDDIFIDSLLTSILTESSVISPDFISSETGKDIGRLMNYTKNDQDYTSIYPNIDTPLSTSFRGIIFLLDRESKIFYADFKFIYNITNSYKSVRIPIINIPKDISDQFIITIQGSDDNLYTYKDTKISIKDPSIKDSLLNYTTALYLSKYHTEDIYFEYAKYVSIISEGMMPQIKDYFVNPLLNSLESRHLSTKFLKKLDGYVWDSQEASIYPANIIHKRLLGIYDSGTYNPSFKQGYSFWNIKFSSKYIIEEGNMDSVITPQEISGATPLSTSIIDDKSVKCNYNNVYIFQINRLEPGEYKLSVGITSTVERTISIFFNENIINAIVPAGSNELNIMLSDTSNPNGGIITNNDVVKYGMEIESVDTFSTTSDNTEILWIKTIKVD